MEDLSPVSITLNAANKSPIKIDGAFFAKLAGQSTSGKVITCQTMIYVSRDVKSLYLSFDTMLDLGILCKDFPKVGMFSTSFKEAEVCSDDTITIAAKIDPIGMICGATRDDGGYAVVLDEYRSRTDQMLFPSLAPLRTIVACERGF